MSNGFLSQVGSVAQTALVASEIGQPKPAKEGAKVSVDLLTVLQSPEK